MRRIYKPLWWVCTLFFGGLGIGGVVSGLLATCAFEIFFRSGNCTPIPESVDLVLKYIPWLVITSVLLLVATLLARRDFRRFERSERFDLFKRADQLRPEDLGFRVSEFASDSDTRKRPFYEGTYISRTAVPSHSATEQNSVQSWQGEGELTNLLQKGGGFVLIGPPLDGKSRTLFEVVKQMTDYIVIKPDTHQRVPESACFSLLKGKKTVLLLEDLTEYVDASVDLGEFVRQLEEHADEWVIAAACREGPELETVRQTVGCGLRKFYEEIPYKLRFVSLSEEEKGRLSQSVGMAWNTENSIFYPTPGFITMDRDIRAMQERFHELEEKYPDQRDILRALRLFAHAGILPVSHERLRWVLESEEFFDRSNLHLQDCLESLTRRSFLRSGGQDPIIPEHAYLLYVVSYKEGKSPEDDFPVLADILESREDYEGLLYLASVCALDDHELALSLFDRVLQIKEDFPEAWLSKGISLYRLTRYTEALEAQKQALAYRPDYPDALVNKANALDELGCREQALTCLDKALELRPSFFEALSNKGEVLHNAGRLEESIEACNRALSIKSDSSQAWITKAMASNGLARQEDLKFSLGRALQLRQEALDIYDQALHLALEDDELGYLHTLINKANCLDEMGRFDQALETYDTVLSISPTPFVEFHARYNKGVALYEAKHFEEALEMLTDALRLKPEDPSTYMFKGLTLYEMKRPSEAVPYLSKAWHVRARLPQGGKELVAETLHSLGYDLR